MQTKWTSDEVKKLIELWNQRPILSGEQIAEQMGRSRSMVLGKINRLRHPEQAKRYNIAPPEARELPAGFKVQCGPKPKAHEENQPSIENASHHFTPTPPTLEAPPTQEQKEDAL